MTTLFTTTALHIAGLQTQLAAATGCSEAAVASLVQEALPVMVHTLGTGGTLGDADAVRDMCQQLSAAQAHHSLAELTRLDNGWPEQRYNLAQALLGPSQLAALAQRHAPAAPAQASQVLGSLGLVVLATAGQQAAEAQLNAAALQGWLSKQVAAENELPRAAAGPFVVPPVARPATKTAPWWPLAALALVGIGASSYFWNQQSAAVAAPKVAAAALPAPKAALAATAAKTVAPAPAVTATAKAPVKPAVERAMPVLRTTPVLAIPLKPTATPALAAKPAAVKKAVTLSTIASRVPLAVAGGRSDGRKAEDRAENLPHVEAKANGNKGNSNSAESLLFARLDNPDVSNRQPIVLERLTFSLGEASLDPEGTQQLANIANLLKAHPRCRLIVFGNAESGEPHSITLALARANAVVAELVKLGVPNAALQAQGHLSTAGGNAADPDYRRRPALYICSLD